MVFPLNNLPTQSRFWGREVEKKIVNLENSLRSSDINNTTRDSQLQVTATQAVVAANQAQDAAEDAAAAAQTANNAITGLGSLDDASSTYKINAANVTVGSLSGDRISGGEIIGTTLKTASTGRRVEIQSTSTAYYDENDNFTGRIIGAGTDRGATLELTSGASGAVYVWNGGVISYGAGGTYAALSDNGFAVGGNRLYTIGANIEADGAIIASGNASSSSISNSGTYTGNGFPSIAANTVTGTTTFAPNVFISSTGNMARNTTTSERRAKENIEELSFDTEAFISTNPVTFNYKREAVSDDEQASERNLGFILDDFEEAGLTDFLIAEPFEGDEYKQLRYNLLYMYLHKVVQEQHHVIKDLTARIEALETN